MTVRAADATTSNKPGERQIMNICTAPSCWEPGEPIEIVGRDVYEDPVLCDAHRKCYLGVST